MKKLIFLLLFPTVLCAADINKQPKYTIFDLENTQSNSYKVRENFKDLYLNKMPTSLAVDNYSTQTIAGDKTFSGDVNVTGFINPGNLGFKTKYVSTNTASVEGGITTVAHGLTASKIVVWLSSVEYATDSALTHGYDRDAEYKYHVTHDATNMRVILDSTNSGNILDKAVQILIFYKE